MKEEEVVVCVLLSIVGWGWQTPGDIVTSCTVTFETMELCIGHTYIDEIDLGMCVTDRLVHLISMCTYITNIKRICVCTFMGE